MKKILALIMALVLVMGLAVTAAAANIEITAPTGNGDKSDLSYTAYKVFSATVDEGDPNNKEDDKASYTYEVDGPFWDVLNQTPLIYADYVPGTNNTKLQVTSLATGVEASDLVNLFKGSTDKGTGIESVYEDGKFVIKNVDPGYYYIESSFGTAMILDTVGQTTITVDPKNDLPTIEKKIVLDDGSKVDTITASAGDTINFEVTVTVPATWDPSNGLYIHDIMDAGMTRKPGVPGGNYNTYWQYYSNCANNTTHNGCFYPRGTDLVPGTYTFTYSATVNSDAVVGGTGNKNTAILQSTDTKYETSDEVTVYTYQIDVLKYQNGNENSPLEGAGFVLKNEDGKYYSKNQFGFITWVDTITDDCVISSDADGKLAFTVLGNGTYTLIEHVVPDGYNKAADQTVTINDGNAEVKVNNQSGSELPSTGGIGTTLFYVVGALMMTGAAVLMITKKRMSV